MYRSAASVLRRLTLASRAQPLSPMCTSTTHFPDKPQGEAAKAEVRRIEKQMEMEELKRRLIHLGGTESNGVVGYDRLLKECEDAGVAKTADEAAMVARAMDDAGAVMLFRDKVYLHPEKVVEQIRKAVPLALSSSEDPRKEEFRQLQTEKEEIDKAAHRQVRRILWSGLAMLITQSGLFLRLTFWEFSWDVMEPITFFTTTSGLIVGYAYFLITARDPTYQDFMERLFTSRQEKLMHKRGFNAQRYLELQNQCKCKYPWDNADTHL